jgi:thiol-disulfide isomerase/thioredoxin
MRTPLPPLEGVATWINADGVPPASELEGRPVLVHFWSISCYICHNVAEQVSAWRDKYGPQGLVVIAIHQPRGPEELDVAKVTEDALGPMGLTQPCAVDSEHLLVQRFQNEFVPAYYVFDKNHELVHRQAGDRGFERLELKIEEVLGSEPTLHEAAV